MTAKAAASSTVPKATATAVRQRDSAPARSAGNLSWPLSMRVHHVAAKPASQGDSDIRSRSVVPTTSMMSFWAAVGPHQVR